MPIYNLRFRRGPNVQVCAENYTEDTASGRFLFHRSKDKSDHDQFFLISEVIGISEIKPQGRENITIPELVQRYKDAGGKLPCDNP